MPIFRGASSDSAATLVEAVGSALGSSDAERVGNDLFTVAETLRTEGALRRFLTDATLPTEARTGLVGEIFDGSVDPATTDLLTKAVSGRWTRPGDLPTALEHAGVVAHVTATGKDAGRLSDELFAVGQMIKDSAELRDALSDPVRSIADKRTLVSTLLDGKVLPATIALVVQALHGTHRTVSAAIEEYQRVAADTHGQGVAMVRVARALSDADQQRLAGALEKQYGRPVHLNLLVDPDVLGGIRVEIGDDVIDGTVATRLADARRTLAG